MICTLIDVNDMTREIEIINYTDNVLFRAFGIIEKPNYDDYQEFLRSRCFPEHGSVRGQDHQGAASHHEEAHDQ